VEQATATTLEGHSAAPHLQSLSDEALQAHLLQQVSRTFALTIPQLPPELAWSVGNAYLLCRTVDTIEDEANLDPGTKSAYCDEFIEVVAGRAPAEAFARRLGDLLTESTPPAEHDLIRCVPRVVAVTHAFNGNQRQAIERCLRIMATGMAEFQQREDGGGLADMAEVDRYCYVVAGVVGEMLTELFCDYSPGIAANRERLLRLSVCFGQGLQMTNILKDVWTDKARGACWLPRSVFAPAGVDLQALGPDHRPPGFDAGLGQLIAITHAHLGAALDYTRLLPPRERGIRNFCLWALGMAVLSLRRLNRRRDYTSGEQVKIARSTVYATAATARLTAGSNLILCGLFAAASLGLPRESAAALECRRRER
jgi:farnesyl-diphosphate farnesyltransferase